MAMDGAEGAEEDMGFDFEDVSICRYYCVIVMVVLVAMFGVLHVYVPSFVANVILFFLPLYVSFTHKFFFFSFFWIRRSKAVAGPSSNEREKRFVTIL